MAQTRPSEAKRERREAGVIFVLVFAGGTVLMGAEIAGSRVLNPFFGSSLFVWGSLISVIMLALASGYYVGGNVADRWPSLHVFCLTAGAAGISLLVVAAVSTPVCAAIARSGAGPRMAPLLAAMVLFLVPGMLMATLSPFAVKLSARDLAGLGNVAGKLYALSTTGSIVGTLLTAFVLIPLMGTRQLIFGLGVALVLVAVAGLVVAGGPGVQKKQSTVGLIVVGVILGLLLAPKGPGAEITPWYDVSRPHTLEHWEDSPYHLILVTEQDHFDPETAGTRKRRVLRFNDRTQSAIYVDDLDEEGVPKRYESAVGYTDLFHLGLIFSPQAKKALFIGGGGGIGPTEFIRHYGMQAEVAEIDAAVERIARGRFHVDERIKYHIGDGRRTLARLAGGYDLIVLDAYSSGGHIPPHLTTKEFLELCREKLAPGGAVVSNVISALEREKSRFYQSQVLTMRAAGFEHVYTFPRFPTPAEERQRGTSKERFLRRDMNIIIVATEVELSTREIKACARRLTEREEHPVHIKAFVHYADGVLVERSEDLKYGIVLTDNYCPVDTMYHDW